MADTTETAAIVKQLQAEASVDGCFTAVAPSAPPKRDMEGSIIRTRRWTRDEDKQLTAAVESIPSILKGPMKWEVVAERVEGRDMIECEGRWKMINDSRRGCCDLSKEARCGLFLVVFITGAIATYVGDFELGDDDFSSPEGEVVEGAAGPSVVAGLVGYTMGPMMLFYGFKVKEFIVVLNALIANGFDSFLESLAYMQYVNAEVSGGKMMPDQLGQLLSIFLSSFTLATAALKVKKLRAAIKGGVIANLVVSVIVDQFPGKYGCMCTDPDTLMDVKCTPVFNKALYDLELRCYDDKWFRFYITYIFIWIAAYFATQAQKLIDIVNSSAVAGNLLNEAIYDTALAVFPEYGSRLQPYRMCSMGLFMLVGVYSQYILTIMSLDGPFGGGDVDTYCKPLFLFLSRIENWVISPLLFLNEGAKAIGNLGNNDNKPAKGGRGGPGSPPNPANLGKQQLGKVIAKLKSQPGLAKIIYVLLINKTTSRIFLFAINFVMMTLSVLIVTSGVALLTSNLSQFFNVAYIVVLVLAGILLFIISLIGFGGGKTGKFKYIVPYALMLSAVLILEVVGMSLLYEKYDLGSPDGAVNLMQSRTMNMYVTANCSTPNADPPPYNISCTEDKYRWYQEFTNTACEYQGEKDLIEVEAKVAAAMERDDYDMIKLYAAELSLIDGTKARIQSCLAAQEFKALGRAATVDDPTGAGAWCVCSNVLLSKVDTLKQLAIACTVVACIQFILILSALRLLGIDFAEIHSNVVAGPAQPGQVAGGRKQVVV